MHATTPAHDESDTDGAGVPRWAATAGRDSLLTCLAANCARLFRVTHRSRARPGTDPNSGWPQPSWKTRQHVLRDYHAANLATARAASEELVRAGFNTGDVPYGYRAHRARVQPPGRRPRWRTRLAIEPVEASTVRMIFLWHGEDRLPLTEIRRRLTVSRYPAPLDPDTGQPGMWTQAIVRAILRNPKYLGRQVWGRTHHGKPVPAAKWVWSNAWAHPPLITVEESPPCKPPPPTTVDGRRALAPQEGLRHEHRTLHSE